MTSYFKLLWDQSILHRLNLKFIMVSSGPGLRFAGTKNGDAQELLYNYAVYFLNEVRHRTSCCTSKHLIVLWHFSWCLDQACIHRKGKSLPKGIVSLHWSRHFGDVCPFNCSFFVRGMQKLSLFPIPYLKRCRIYNLSQWLCEQVMAGSGNLQTFRLLRFLRSRNSTDGHANYGIQMAVSFLS